MSIEFIFLMLVLVILWVDVWVNACAPLMKEKAYQNSKTLALWATTAAFVGMTVNNLIN